AALQFNGCDYVTVKGMTIMRTGTNALAQVIHFKGGAHHNTLENNRLIATVRTSINTTGDNVWSEVDKDTANIIRNNYIKYGNIGINLKGVTSAHENGTIIENNTIDSVVNIGIRADFNDKIIISGNIITNVLGTTTTSDLGISLNDCDGAIRVIRNYVALGTPEFGIVVENSGASSSAKGIIANNFVSMNGNSKPYGILMSGSLNQLVAFNSVNIASSNTGAALMTDGAITGSYELKNNILANLGGGYALEVTTTSQIASSNYNDLYTSGTALVRWGGTNYSTLAAYKTASSQDANSLNIHPRYTSTTDLHIKNSSLNSRGTAISGILVDIDGQTRGVVPDIGADEFDLATTDAGINGFTSPLISSCAGSTDIIAEIKNYGKDTLRSATIHWKLNGVTQTSYSWSGKLATDSAAGIKLSTNTFSAGTTTLKAWTSNPNSTSDLYLFNDTTFVSITFTKAPTPAVGNGKLMCSGNSSTIGAAATSGNFYSWTSNPSGFTSNSANPTVMPMVTTMYYLTQTDSATGCSAKDSVKVTVMASATPNAGKDTAICVNDSARIGVPTQSGNRYSWSSDPPGFSSTLADPKVSPTVTTTYILSQSLIATGCTLKDTVTVTVMPRPKANPGLAKSVCPGDSVQIGSPAVSGNGYLWQSSPAGFASTAAEPWVRPSVITTYYLTETVNATGCSKSDSVVVSLNNAPNINAGANSSICSGEITQIGTTSQPGQTYAWRSIPFGFSSSLAQVSVKPTQTTTYILKQTGSSNACSAEDSITITVLPRSKPIISGLKNLCGASLLTYSTPKNGSNTYSWSVQGGTIISGQGTEAVNVLWDSTGGTGTVKVVETSSGTCKDSAFITVAVTTQPGARFSHTGNCAGIPTVFADASRNANKWLWSFGNGQTSTQASPQYTYNTPGNYQVKLVVTAAGGCKDSMIFPLVISGKPTPAFTSNRVCQGNPTVFTNTSTDGNNYLWNFGDGQTSILQNPQHTYGVAGNYQVLLTVSNNAGCADTITNSVTVLHQPSAVWNASINFRTVTFSPQDTTLASYKWVFGDGDSSTGVKPIHKYTAINTWMTVKLSVVHKDGCSAEFTDSILVGTIGIGDDGTPGAKVSIYPNPFNMVTTVNVTLAEHSPMRIVLYDATGRELSVIASGTYSAGEQLFSVNSEALGLMPGIYLLQVNLGGINTVQRIVKVD
nr:PKD domain-containing protein [Bacteroidota bacterium]